MATQMNPAALAGLSGVARRLVVEGTLADEEARRAADKEHRRTINRQAIADLIESGLSQEMAEKALIAIASGKVSAISIKY